jgi:glucan phosphoethanolaminetransferase (alkaline phosphatase superfamily)
MAIILTILDLLVLVAVVISVFRAVNGGTTSRLLSACIVVAMIIFGLVSFAAANGLTVASTFNQAALLIFLVAIAVVTRIAWAKNAGEPRTSGSESFVGSKTR